jgi:hypothetical protein
MLAFEPRREKMKFKGIATVMALLLLASSSSAIEIDVGPTYAPPGMGTEIVEGDPDTSGGMTIAYRGVDPSQTANLYFGIRNDLWLNGFSMDGSEISDREIFRFDLVGGIDQILYTGTTTLEILLPGPEMPTETESSTVPTTPSGPTTSAQGRSRMEELGAARRNPLASRPPAGSGWSYS